MNEWNLIESTIVTILLLLVIVMLCGVSYKWGHEDAVYACEKWCENIKDHTCPYCYYEVKENWE